MKSFWALLLGFSIVAAHGDSTNLPPAKLTLPAVDNGLASDLTPTNGAPLQNGDPWSLSGSVKRAELTPRLTLVEKPNELRLGNVTLSGSLVETVKVDNRLQLINPWAPREYGESRDNTAFSVINNQVTGWKLIAIEF